MKVRAAVVQHALRRIAVTACATGFLAVLLDSLGQRGVYDKAHIRAIDAHAEGDGCYDHIQLFS